MPHKDRPAVAAELIKVFPQITTGLMSGYSERLSSGFDRNRRESALEAISEYINLFTFAEQGHCAHID